MLCTLSPAYTSGQLAGSQEASWLDQAPARVEGRQAVCAGMLRPGVAAALAAAPDMAGFRATRLPTAHPHQPGQRLTHCKDHGVGWQRALLAARAVPHSQRRHAAAAGLHPSHRGQLQRAAVLLHALQQCLCEQFRVHLLGGSRAKGGMGVQGRAVDRAQQRANRYMQPYTTTQPPPLLTCAVVSSVPMMVACPTFSRCTQAGRLGSRPPPPRPAAAGRTGLGVLSAAALQRRHSVLLAKHGAFTYVQVSQEPSTLHADSPPGAPPCLTAMLCVVTRR